MMETKKNQNLNFLKLIILIKMNQKLIFIENDINFFDKKGSIKI